MNKTAVEWFEQKLDDLDIEIPQSIFEEAKEIEKQQIMEAWSSEGTWDDDFLTGEQYYNEKFKK